jgi:hypothetical protein
MATSSEALELDFPNRTVLQLMLAIGHMALLIVMVLACLFVCCWCRPCLPHQLSDEARADAAETLLEREAL